MTAYREAMAGFAGMRTLDIWYANLPEDELMAAVRGTVADMARTAKGKQGKKKAKTAEKTAERGEKMARKARTRDSVQALSRLGELVDGEYRIVSQPPVIVPARDLAATFGISPDVIGQVIRGQLRAYRATLQLDRRRLLERFEIVDMARKVVGVGSVGTRAYIVLLHGRDAEDPLFLQIKEATASVLEDHLPTSRFAQPGERVVQGQRMMQAARKRRVRSGRVLPQPVHAARRRAPPGGPVGPLPRRPARLSRRGAGQVARPQRGGRGGVPGSPAQLPGCHRLDPRPDRAADEPGLRP